MFTDAYENQNKGNHDFHTMKAKNSQNMYIYWKSNNLIVTGIVT